MNVALKCRCGKVKGVLYKVSAEKGNHLICLCDDCQCFAHFLNRSSDVLDENGGTEIFQTLPSQVRIEEGEEFLSCMRLSPKGILRWFTQCCRTPIGNTLPTPKVPFLGLIHSFIDMKSDQLENVLGPVRGRVHSKFAKGELKKDPRHHSQLVVIGRSFKMVFLGWLGKKWKPTPFFSESGRPASSPVVLTLDQRNDLRASLAKDVRQK